jgi:hypothetical protein
MRATTTVLVKAVTLITASCAADGQPVRSIFIPLSPVTKEAVAELRERMKAEQFTECEIDEAVASGAFLHREGAVRGAFASVRPSDRRLSVCSNSIMGGATRIVFISEPSASEVTVKTASCDAEAGGLWCSPMAERRA